MAKTLQKLLFFAGIAAALLAPTASDAQTYCSATNSYGCYYRMTSFSTSGGSTNISHSGISCSTPFSNSTNSAHTTTSHTGLLGSTVSYSLQNYTYMYTTIFVDWNQDGDFTDVGERVVSNNYGYSNTGSFSIPTSAAIGATTMRVRNHWFTSSPPPCGSIFDYGNIIDYNFVVTSPCAAVTSVSTTPYAKSAMFSWPSATGAVSYDYKVTQGASFNNVAVAGGTTTGTTATVTGLTPTTNYYVHVRNQCAVYPASWASFPFTTTACAAPAASFSNVTHNSALVLWSSVSVASQYDYVVSDDPTPPGTGASVQSASGSTIQLNGLDPETAYYFFIRSVCPGEISEWVAGSFTTMAECQAPVVNIVRSGTEPVEANWEPVPTAIAYEWAINSSATPPALGTTEYGKTLSLAPLPDDKKPYYFHIRAKCVSIFTTSEWSTQQLREADPTAVSNVHDDQLIVQVYPNPVNNIVTIQVDGAKQPGGTVTIADVMGKQITTTAATGTKTNIDMSGIAAGVYFIKYTNGSHSQSFRVSKL